MTDTSEVGSQLRLDLLREALPYIQRFKGKTFVVKFSGKVTEERDRLISLCEELALLHQVGIRVCVIHGGGKQLSDLARKLGVEQTIIEGRRVTDDDTLEMAKMIFAGKINTDILAALRYRGVHAVGLSGIDGNIVHAERRPPREVTNKQTGESAQVDFGHVGDILEIDARLLTVLLDHGYLPVVSSLGADAEGKVFNINADTIAAEIAVQLQAEKLVLLSDVEPAVAQDQVGRSGVEIEVRQDEMVEIILPFHVPLVGWAERERDLTIAACIDMPSAKPPSARTAPDSPSCSTSGSPARAFSHCTKS